jgi:hypothetical protein
MQNRFMINFDYLSNLFCFSLKYIIMFFYIYPIYTFIFTLLLKPFQVLCILYIFQEKKIKILN